MVFRVGIVGTGYAAKRRIEAFFADRRSPVVAISGSAYRVQSLAQSYGIGAIADWRDLVARDDLDLVAICNVNREHGAIARAALTAGKHVIVEYPLALDPVEAAALIELAKVQEKLLHVEHIELLGGLHQTVRDYLPRLGEIFYAQYISLAPKQHPLPHWTYYHEDYGFPLVAALSRVNRLIDLFGTVTEATGTAHFLDADATELAGHYHSCLCAAQLKFQNGVVAHLTYGKGSLVNRGDRRLTVHGEGGSIEFIGNQGRLILDSTTIEIDAGKRRGVFKKDTTAVLDYLTTGEPLYIQAEQSLYALQIADQIRRSAALLKE